MSDLAQSRAAVGAKRSQKTFSNKTMKKQSRSLSEAQPTILPLDSRIANIEWLRILAIYGIVWFHTDNLPGRSIGYAGLPIFLLLFYALSSRKPKPESFVVFAKKKASRLLKPWIFWIVVYTVCILIKRTLDGSSHSKIFSGYIFLAGPKIHLWYMPFAFLSGLLVNLLQRFTQKISPKALVFFGALIGGVLLLFCSMLMTSITIMPIKWNTPIPQWIFALPAIPLGFSIGRAYSGFHSQDKKRPLLYLWIVLVVEAVCLIMFCFNYIQMIIPYSIAILLVCVAFLSKSQCGKTLLKFSSLAFGIYLIHPLIASLLDVIGLNSIHSVVFATMLFFISALIVMLFQKTPLRQFV